METFEPLTIEQIQISIEELNKNSVHLVFHDREDSVNMGARILKSEPLGVSVTYWDPIIAPSLTPKGKFLVVRGQSVADGIRMWVREQSNHD